MTDNYYHVTASVYGNRIPDTLSYAYLEKNGYEYDDDAEEFLSIKLEIDTRKLTVEEEDIIYGMFEDIRDNYRCIKRREDDDFQGWLDVETVKVDGANEDVNGKILAEGYVTESDWEVIDNTVWEYRDKITVSGKW